jgi:vancomycin resistance protein VanW
MLLKKLKIKLKLLLRLLKDLKSGNYFHFSKKNSSVIEFPHFMSVSQEVKPSETFENKLYNLQLAANKINEYVVLPNQIFSFWKIVGNPNYNFKNGRTLINGKVSEEKGGGLCQISGIIYYISILAGLEVLERFNHSMDIYTDDTRFAPLGTDATVVYGYKDLRIKNNLPFPIRFSIRIENNFLEVNLLSEQFIQGKKIIFEIEEKGEVKIVDVFDENQRKINRSIYKNL